MKKYKCSVCGYIYDPVKGDPDSGIKPGTAFEDLPDDWVCPVCGSSKDKFRPMDQTIIYSFQNFKIVHLTKDPPEDREDQFMQSVFSFLFSFPYMLKNMYESHGRLNINFLSVYETVLSKFCDS